MAGQTLSDLGQPSPYLSTDPYAGSMPQGGNGGYGYQFPGSDFQPGAGSFYDNTSGGGVTFDPSQRSPNTGINGGATGTGGPQGAAPSFTAGMTPDQVRQAVTQYYASRGVTPNPTSIDYWTQKYQEFGNNDPAYFGTRLSQADEFGGGGNGGSGGGQGGFGGRFQLPSLQDAMNMPGLQFAIDRGTNGIQHAALNRGTGLSGGALKDIADYTTGAALQGYGTLAQLGLGYDNGWANARLGIGQLGLNGSSVGATGQPA